MQFDSIKSRLMLMTIICVLGMGLLLATQHYSIQRLSSLHQQQELLLRLGQDLLQMRRHEKDFLLRNQMVYFQRFTERSADFSSHLHALSPVFAEYDLPVTKAGELAEAMLKYEQLFFQVATLQQEIGLTATQGLKGQLGAAESELLRQPAFSASASGYPALVQTRLATRDFLLTRDPYFRRHFDTMLRQLTHSDKHDKVTQGLLKRYETTFNALASRLKMMGMTQNEGLRGQFREQAHAVEALLGDIDEAIGPLIKAQENRARVTSISIAAATCIALILLLLKSFATFHRAFANFVMFFYRCKRQYQKIDPRQLGFAEFKSLAELANEMVESKREVENRLACVEAALKVQQGEQGIK